MNFQNYNLGIIGAWQNQSQSHEFMRLNSWVIHEKRLNVLCKSRCTHTYKRSFDFDLKFETWNHPLSEYKSKIRAWSKHINGQPGLPGDINGPCKDQWPTQCEPKPPLQKKTTPKKTSLGDHKISTQRGFPNFIQNKHPPDADAAALMLRLAWILFRPEGHLLLKLSTCPVIKRRTVSFFQMLLYTFLPRLRSNTKDWK